MPRFFQPSLSYRADERGGGLRDFGAFSGGGRLTGARSTVFLVHGYNNDQPSASAAYEKFVPRLGEVSPRVIGVYWPGDNWASGAYYINAVKKVDAVARRFARDIHAAAVGGGLMEISFVAHSLGCRLVLETLRELDDLQRAQPAPGLKLQRVVFMAGAVPTFYLEPRRPLHSAVRSFGVKTKSLFSDDDRVLRRYFPIGQSLAGEGFFPVALGRRPWQGSTNVSPAMEQKDNPGADHSDYWGAGSDKPDALTLAAEEVRAFIPLGRPSPPRTTPVRATRGARPTEEARATPSRHV